MDTWTLVLKKHLKSFNIFKNIVQRSSIIYNIMNTLRYVFKLPLCPAI